MGLGGEGSVLGPARRVSPAVWGRWSVMMRVGREGGVQKCMTPWVEGG